MTLTSCARWALVAVLSLSAVWLDAAPARAIPAQQSDGASGCGGTAPPLPPMASGTMDGPQIINATVGQPFSITLEANPTTGYSWALAQPLDESVLQVVQHTYQRGGPAMPGAGGNDVWTFEPLCAGFTTIALKYRRPWEPDDPTARQATYYVSVGS